MARQCTGGKVPGDRNRGRRLLTSQGTRPPRPCSGPALPLTLLSSKDGAVFQLGQQRRPRRGNGASVRRWRGRTPLPPGVRLARNGREATGRPEAEGGRQCHRAHRNGGVVLGATWAAPAGSLSRPGSEVAGGGHAVFDKARDGAAGRPELAAHGARQGPAAAAHGPLHGKCYLSA